MDLVPSLWQAFPIMANSSAAEKIRQLSAKAIAATDPEDLKEVASQLRAALHEHLQNLKDTVAERARRSTPKE
jgi:hypothetical protein